MKTYYTIIAKDKEVGSLYQIIFGGYDAELVTDELHEERSKGEYACIKMITTDHAQEAINTAVDRLNGVGE